MNVMQNPFRTTHVRDDNQVHAMLLAISDGIALYWVRFRDGDKSVTRLTSCSERRFRERFV